MRDAIVKILRRVVREEVPLAVTVPDDRRFGDCATNVAFLLAKVRRLPPLEVAGELREELERAGAKLFERVDVVPPGFLNFHLKAGVLHAALRRILERGKGFGSSKALLGKKIQAEFISANPTGPLTLANGRGGFLGDALANVLERAGAKVEREYYVNDTGNQVLTLGKSILAAAGLLEPGEGFYRGAYVREWARAHTREVKKLAGDPLTLGERAAKDFLKMIRGAVEKKAKIHFDRYTSEKQHIHKGGFVTKALAAFRRAGVTYEQDGATWLRTTSYGDDKDRVLITKEKLPTYFLADAGHYLETKRRGFDAKINILGPDHYGYVGRIQAAAKLLSLRESHVIITQAVRLVRGGAEVRMSKRRGEFVTFEELVREVGPDVARFFLLSVAPSSHLDFDLALAKERSLKNPVYYVQYALVRAKNILKKARLPKGPARLANLWTPEDRALILALARFPDLVQDTARDFAVHRLTRYALELACAFHDFYEKERVLGAPAAEARARAALVRATVIVLENLLLLLGVSIPARM